MPSTPILRLPVELHLEIANLLDLGDHVRLASTARYFRSIIPAPTHSDFLAAEECAWAKSKQFTCGSLTDQLGHHGMCAACSPDTKRDRGNQYFDHDDHWTYATNRMSDRNHVREFYNWPEDGRLPRF
ncbi:hypothetical protein CFE70_002938 [Pyrenophora teres f. teres 0-1]